MRGAAILALLTVASWAASAAVPDADLRLAETRGAAIAAYDRAAWIATDAMLLVLPDPDKAGVRGYMVVPDGAGLRAIFYGGEPKRHVPIFEAGIRDGAIVSSGLVADAARRPVGQLVERFIAAREAIWGVSYQRCNDASMNTVVMPAENGRDTIVYLLTSQKDAGVYPAGGHHRIMVDARGKVRERRSFTKGCIDLSDANAPAGAKVAEFTVSHSLDPNPTEVHVWLSRWSGKPVNVVTRDGHMWRVADGRIEDKGALSVARP